MSLHVSVDFGTSSTCTVVSVDGGEPQVVVIDGQPLVPSAVCAGSDGTVFVGHEAERQAALDPARFEPHPKRRIDEGELLLGSSVFGVGDVVRAVLRRAVGEARRYAAGAAVDLLVLTHPADWGSVRTGRLREAAAGLGTELVMVPEPVAAAVFHSAGHGLPDGGALAVLDLGGGTVDASVVRKQGPAFHVLATRGDPNFGGADIDQALLEHVGRTVSHTDPDAWAQLVSGRELADRRRRRAVRQDVRGAKETLSRHTYTDIPMPPPFSDAHVTRADLEGLVAAPLAKAADLVLGTLRAGGVPRARLRGVFLVGGASRIPLVARLVHERTGVVPTTLDQPETVVARGALRAVRLDPDGFAGLAPTGTWSGSTAPTVRRYAPGSPAPAPVGTVPPTSGAPPPVPLTGDAMSDATTIVMSSADPAPAPAPPRRSKASWVILAVGAVVAVTAAVLTTVGRPDGSIARHVAGDQYAFDHPPSWERAGGDADPGRVVIRPAADSGPERIAVRRDRLGYDVETGRERAVQELRRQYRGDVRSGRRLSDFRDVASFAGREVVSYRERMPGATVDWYVVQERQSRVRVGCQYAPMAEARVRRACEQVVGSLVVR